MFTSSLSIALLPRHVIPKSGAINSLESVDLLKRHRVEHFYLPKL